MRDDAVVRLRHAVLNYHRTDLNYHRTDRVCALLRLQIVEESESTSLTECAMGVGFTRMEARGLMDGWDVADGRANGCFEDWVTCSSMEYDEARALGRQLWIEAHSSVGGIPNGER